MTELCLSLTLLSSQQHCRTPVWHDELFLTQITRKPCFFPHITVHTLLVIGLCLACSCSVVRTFPEQAQLPAAGSLSLTATTGHRHDLRDGPASL